MSLRIWGVIMNFPPKNLTEQNEFKNQAFLILKTLEEVKKVCAYL